jgi:hypothetical protein
MRHPKESSMRKHDPEPAPSERPPPARGAAVAPRSGKRPNATWHDDDARRFPADRADRLNSTGSSIAGEGARRQKPDREH